MKSFGRGVDLLIVIAAVMGIPALASAMAAPFAPFAREVDPSGLYLYVSIHHVFQLILTLFLMKAFIGTSLAEWGFNLREYERSLRITAKFCLIYLGPVFLVNVVPTLMSGRPPEFGHPLTAENIGGRLGFQFVLSGLCEEPLFRGFAITFLAQSWTGRIRLGRVSISSAGLWATLLFMLAHAQISLSPFSLRASLPQQIWSLGLGVYYAIVFERTKSLLAPILSHGYSNGVIFLILYTWALLAA